MSWGIALDTQLCVVEPFGIQAKKNTKPKDSHCGILRQYDGRWGGGLVHISIPEFALKLGKGFGFFGVQTHILTRPA